ncbi:hypothetical protein DOTSEDRAFT_175363 [Dothistroma septosporum NZE10]|uniref:Zn(2)-C6 fungal-type domain-containing protein n=1 Tax=Dothistroma septosporum (strain NZE10 / CBS 128990) TaxID=675120 RepID=N1PLB9_DOTSN|nr:hypothetical protein DOTSEDRAFT_175363 [Dothistroma septosporum NZE10]
MPRPKVKPQDRQRSAKACLPCKASKIRCSAGTPCGPCLKRERISACIYLESSRKRQKTSHIQTETSPFPTPSIEDASPQLDASAGAQRVPPVAPVAPFEPTEVRPVASVVPSSVNTTTTSTPEPGKDSSRLTQSRMLLSSKGEKLYVGENASLSFLQFLRQVLKKHIGPSAFTENHFKDNMLEVEMARGESPLLYDQTRGEKEALVQFYREASSGILDLFTMDDIHGFLDRHNALSPSIFIDEEDKSARAEQAFLNMMLAIGSQCRGQNPFDSCNAARYFTSAQKYAFEGFVCDPTLNMVRVFLLMAFYMLGACHRNAAFMYLGIASKAASALGLHKREPNKAMSPLEYITRWRTWKSLLILDTIVSSILGRPGSSPFCRSTQEDSMYDGDEQIEMPDRPRWLASQAVFMICSHIIELEQQLVGSGKQIDSSSSEGFLRRLRQWNDTLPLDLRHFAGLKSTTLGPSDRELFIGSVHVACTYYFSIILVTRPFLISHLISQLRRQRPAARRPSTEGNESSHLSDLAQACLDAAMYMAKTGFMAINSVIMSNNMRLLKAWMFAAGLLLGFSMFAQAEPFSEVDDAFQNAIAVLERLARCSLQARHYFEILSTFSDAILLRREQLARERRKKSDRFVSQIFTAAFHDGTQDAIPLATPSSGASNIDPNMDPGGSLGTMNNLGFDFTSAAYDLPTLSDREAWTDMPLLSDNLYIDWESIWPVMDSR